MLTGKYAHKEKQLVEPLKFFNCLKLARYTRFLKKFTLEQAVHLQYCYYKGGATPTSIL